MAAGLLYRSTDGGSSWQLLETPAGVTPTAVAISPTYAQDQTLLLGTAEGQVVPFVVP